MGLMSFLKKQFIDVIEIPSMDENTLLVKYPMQDQEIQNGAVLVVRESQMALFVNEGKLADVFLPGTHKLTTQTLPLLTNLKNWDKLFDSPFKSDVYFVNTKQMMNAGWGTSQPITIRDTEFGMIRLRAYGKYTYKITNIQHFFTQISGAVDFYGRDSGVEDQLRNQIISAFSSFAGTAKVPFIDLAANQGLFGDELKKVLKPNFEALGLEITQFTIENLNLPEKLQEMLDKKISVGIMGNDISKYTQLQIAESIPLAAGNDGGIAGLGMALGMGMNMAGAMNNQIAQAGKDVSSDDLTAKLVKLKQMFESGLIDEVEYKEKKAEILDKM